VFLKKKKTWYSVLGVGASLILSKLKYVLIVFKVGKIGFTFISMLVTIWTYSLIYGWKFAVGFVLLLFVHENGHLLAAKMKNLNVTKPVFIPFVGAVIALKERPKDASTEAFIAIGGPLAAGFASLMCYLIFLFDKSGLFLSFAYTGFFLNLFNLIPVHPLDGGRIVTAISTKLWVLGLAVLSYFAFDF
jgi:Zn-dependent protease